VKLKYPKNKNKINSASTRQGLLVGILGIVAFSFLAGIFFDHSGYAAKFVSAIRGLRQSDVVVRTVEEINEEISTEVKLYQSNGLANLFLDIPFDSMMEIEDKREEALAIGVLFTSDDDFVPATLRYNDEQTLDINLRLKGDWVDHLVADKWSYRIHITENDGAVLGMRRFSIQAPHTRNYVSEWGYQQNLFLEDILATRYHFVNVIINGEHKGIYALEESFHEDLLESQGRREGIIFRVDEELFWHDWAQISNDDFTLVSANWCC